MKKFTRVVAIVLTIAMATLMFASCNKQETNGPIKNDDGTYTVKIGGIGATSGAYANYGTSVKQGAQLAVDQINAAGGFDGIKFELLFEDSQGVAESAVAAYGKLLDDGMIVSLGGTMSGETASIVAEGKEDGILILTPTASAKESIAGNDNAFRVCFNDPQQGTASAQFIYDNGLATKVAVFYQSDTDYSSGLYDTFKAECSAKGIEIIAEQTFTSDSSSDFTAQINKLKEAKENGATVIFTPIYAEEAATFLTQAAQAGLTDDTITVFGCDGLDGVIDKLDDPKNAEGTMLLTSFAADSNEADVKAFVDAYKAKYNAVPDQFAASAYDAVYAIKAAMQKAGLKDGDFDNFNERLVAAMTQIEVDGVTGTSSIKWTADGEAEKKANAVIIKDGVAVAYTKN